MTEEKRQICTDGLREALYEDFLKHNQEEVLTEKESDNCLML